MDLTVNTSKFAFPHLDGMVEKRMKDAVLAIGTAWHTAWLAAGKPDLSGLKAPPDLVNEAKEKLDEAYQKGNILGRKHDSN